MESITHTAQFYGWFMQEAGLEQVDLVGVGVGGWIAAEMAVMDPSVLRHLVLVGAAGVRPREGEIADVFVVPWGDVIKRSFADAEASTEYQRIYGERPVQDFGGERESGRSMAMRTCYRPYMHNPALPSLLGRVRTPTLVVWGAQDISCRWNAVRCTPRRSRARGCRSSTTAATWRTSSGRMSWRASLRSSFLSSDAQMTKRQGLLRPR